MADIEVDLPDPCSEPWEGMTPQGCNRHCATCDKTIHDLARLSLDEAEALLDGAEEVCVRAEIDAAGVVKLSPGGSSAKRAGSERRMIAKVGAASLALATAACQTVPAAEKPNRFEISGSVPWFYEIMKPVIRSSDGQTWRVEMAHRSTDFRVPELFPGVYSLTYQGTCGEQNYTIEDIVIRDSSIDLGQLEGDGDCIFIGRMQLKDRPGRL